ncbi:MAG: hypothetical protein K5872_03625 [Rhizobiaceae bacterium]|nr:hypothetical protein [Rhizobiaceae bacterium]MCV0405300.1 hypothetical protein [Rhizobiaceae bacterium]
MDGYAARGDGRRLRRIAALLVALAALAEQAAGRCYLVRCLVLWLLRRAEAAAEAFVFDQTGVPVPALAGFAADGNGPADALRLAARFMVLAAALGALLLVARRLRRRPARSGLTFGHVLRGFSRLLGRWPHLAPKLNDTS